MTEPTRLRPGDKVVCRIPDGHWLERGRTYKVVEVLDDGFGSLVGINVLPGVLWSAARFEEPSE